jgi:probable F420-dependent oxidoreductase
VRIGVTFARLRPALWAETVELCDELGYESVWLPEHLVLPVQQSGSPYAGAEHPPVRADAPVFDVFTMLAFFAGRTGRIRLGTNVYNIGLRHPFITARGVATLDVVSDGRVELGIGASWLAEEWEATGLDFAARGSRVDEALDVCKRLWTDTEIEHKGEHFQFASVAFEPKPVQAGGPPISVGGDSLPALRRAALHGDGWIPMNTPMHGLAAKRAEIEQMRAEAGRDGEFTVTAMGAPSSRDDVEAYERAGVDRLVVFPWRRSAEAADGLRSFAQTFLNGGSGREEVQ